jgi:hypothetical protein
MKKLLILFYALATLMDCPLFSQDIIIKNDKSEIKAKVIEIQETTIKYKLYDFLEGPLRNIAVSDVFMIIYENGKRETFSAIPETKPAQKQNLSDNPAEESLQKVPNKEKTYSNLGFVFGGKGGFYIPYNQDVSKIYGSGFMFGVVIGYWADRSAIEIDWKYYSKRGNPYNYGSVDNSTAKLTLSPVTVTGYWIPYSHANFTTYVGGGLGACFIDEYVSITSSGQSTSNEISPTGFEFHTTGGIKFKPFYFDVTFSSILENKYYKDKNLGGIILGFGLFF